MTTTATRRFVRRQHSWFDRDERINWLEIVGGDQQPTNVLERRTFAYFVTAAVASCVR